MHVVVMTSVKCVGYEDRDTVPVLVDIFFSDKNDWFRGFVSGMIFDTLECTLECEYLRNKNSHHKEIHTNDLTKKISSTLIEPK